MPSPLHYIPFAHRDWLSSSRVRRMPLAAQGAYLALLCYQWEDGGIPAAPEDVARILGITAKEMAVVWRYLEPAFPVGEDGERRNPRMALDREEAHRKVTKNRLNGALGGRPKAAAEEPAGDPNGRQAANRTVRKRIAQSEPKAEPETDTPSEPSGSERALVRPPLAGQDGGVFERVRLTLTLVAEGTGTAVPPDERVREWLSDRRRLAPLLREIEPREAAELFLWCGRHFVGGKPWGVIHDNLGVYRQQMQNGVSALPRGGSGGRMDLLQQMEEARVA